MGYVLKVIKTYQFIERSGYTVSVTNDILRRNDDDSLVTISNRTTSANVSGAWYRKKIKQWISPESYPGKIEFESVIFEKRVKDVILPRVEILIDSISKITIWEKIPDSAFWRSWSFIGSFDQCLSMIKDNNHYVLIRTPDSCQEYYLTDDVKVELMLRYS